MRASTCGTIIAAPRPCTARDVISSTGVPANPHAVDAIVKSAMPQMKSRR